MRWFRKERQIVKDIEETIRIWKSPEGMRMFKCQANGKKAVEKVFKLAKGRDNVLVWNAGLMSKMRQGVPLHQDTMVWIAIATVGSNC